LLFIMMRSMVIALTLALGAAFVPDIRPSAPRSSARTAYPPTGDAPANVKDMPGILPPVGFFDPLGLSTNASPEQILWFRACELKHGRIAMLATTGFLVQQFYTLPGMLSSAAYTPQGALSFGDAGLFPDVAFSSVPKGVGAWEAIPYLGQAQILSVIFCLEWYAESQKPHYMKGGKMGSIPVLWDPFDLLVNKSIAKMNDAQKLGALNKELQNGRLAMIGAMGFSSAALIPGSVPGIPDGVF